jgi:hypothetical protein
MINTLNRNKPRVRRDYLSLGKVGLCGVKIKPWGENSGLFI